MWIMIAGPFTHGSQDQQDWKANHKVLNEYAYAVFKKGHVPVIGVNCALPIIGFNNEASLQEVMMPLSMEMAKRCDAVLRIGGPSKGADQEVDLFKGKDLPIFHSLDEIPVHE